MATITETQRRRLVISSVAFILAAATMMMPITTDARGGAGFRGGGFGGRAGTLGGSALRNSGPTVAGPATVRRFPFSSRRLVWSHWRSSNTSALNRSVTRRFASRRPNAIGSHFFTLGYDGVWVDNYVYAPTVLIAQQPAVALPQSRPNRAPSVKTPSAARSGIIVVRGDTKSYVTFPSPRRG